MGNNDIGANITNNYYINCTVNGTANALNVGCPTEDLPENCRNYIEFIEKEIGYPITMVSNGPKRHEIIYR